MKTRKAKFSTNVKAAVSSLYFAIYSNKSQRGQMNAQERNRDTIGLCLFIQHV